MRIGPAHVVQLIEGTPSKLVIVSEEDGNEVVLDKEAVDKLQSAVTYLYPHL